MPEEDAIQSDVLEAEATTEETTNEIVDNRMDAIEALAESRQEEIKAEVVEHQEAIEELVDKPEPEPEDDPPEQLFTVKVDGEEHEVSLADMQKGYQKDATASKRLDQVALERRELDAQKAEFNLKKAEFNQANVETTQQAEEVKPSVPDVDEDAAKLKLANAYDELSVAVSDEERISAVDDIRELEKMLSGRSEVDDTPAIQIDANEIAQQAAQQATKQMQFQTAQAKFVADYQDIVDSTQDDGYRTQVFNSIFQESLQDASDYNEAYAKTAEAYRQWNGVAAPKDDGMQDKKAKKEALPSEPASVGTRAQPAPSPKEPTTSEIILGMKASRGQAV